MGEQFDVFLSYNTKDKPEVKELARLLHKQNIKVWLDEDQLVPGRLWQDELEKIIREVKTAAILIGEDGFGPWSSMEMRSCISQFTRRELPVIPTFLPNASDEERLPDFLQEFTWVDFRNGFAREQIDRLIWGITGSKPDKLKSS